jgi:uncharacterized protein (DUF2147 family)
MSKPITALLLALCLSVFPTFAQPSTTLKSDAIIGVWTNPAKDAKFEIYRNNNLYFGKVIWGTGSEAKDSKNPDPKLRSRELVGLTILNNFEFDEENTWDGGTIYDPKEGKTYACVLTLTAPNALNVRGYVGFSLFGRTETWTRIR